MQPPAATAQPPAGGAQAFRVPSPVQVLLSSEEDEVFQVFVRPVATLTMLHARTHLVYLRKLTALYYLNQNCDWQPK
jgi:hypothetical protein